MEPEDRVQGRAPSDRCPPAKPFSVRVSQRADVDRLPFRWVTLSYQDFPEWPRRFSGGDVMDGDAGDRPSGRPPLWGGLFDCGPTSHSAEAVGLDDEQIEVPAR